MKVGNVVGTVVSTINIPLLDEHRLLLCDVQDVAGEPDGYTICIDVVDAGMGETVLILDEGNSARQILGLETGAIRAVIVGVVDELYVDGELREVI
ncbi:MAG TPA: EutN/CcmL family microcompartment protein [Acidimicrobiia bacterium]|nr:EutN/CcmL family microcompartment protein [Acidimicrobiia bacterium]